jgi:hypothetical protein
MELVEQVNDLWWSDLGPEKLEKVGKSSQPVELGEKGPEPSAPPEPSAVLGQNENLVLPDHRCEQVTFDERPLRKR